MIIYIHGFSSHGISCKAKILKEGLIKFGVISPSLSYIPDLAIDTLKQLINSYLKYEKVYLIGSSLGGYYALYLSDYFQIPAILINSSLNPSSSLKKYLGNKNINYYDNSTFEWNLKHLKQLRKYNIQNINSNLYLLLTQKGDEILNYKEAVRKLKDSQQLIREGGNHRFDNLENEIISIKKFLEKSLLNT